MMLENANFVKKINDVNLLEADNSYVRGIEKIIENYKVVVFPKQSLKMHDLIRITNCVGKIEEAWEDKHPKNKFIQLLDSKKQKIKDAKSSSQIWHIDRSFTKQPTRYTFLYADEVIGNSSSTEICDTSRLWIDISPKIRNIIDNKNAVHSFSHMFPAIMKSKGYSDEKIKKDILLYPDVSHPTIRNINQKKSLYFNQLCTNKFIDLSLKENELAIDEISEKLEKCYFKYKHEWSTGDLLVWDNFQTTHRAVKGNQNSIRRLFRTTVGEK